MFNLLKLLKITKKFIYPTIKRLGTIDDKPRSGCPHETRTNAAIKAVTKIIHRNSLCKQKVMAREMKILPRTTPRIINEDLALGAYRRSTGQRLTEAFVKLE